MEAEPKNPPNLLSGRLLLGAGAVLMATALTAVFSLDRVATRLDQQVADLTTELDARIRRRPPIPAGGPPTAAADSASQTSAFALYTRCSRQLDSAGMQRLGDAFSVDPHPLAAELTAIVESHRQPLDAALAAAAEPLGALRADPAQLGHVDAFAQLHLGDLLRAAALVAAEQAPSPDHRTRLWAAAFQHARDLSDHSSLLLTMVGAALVSKHTGTLTASLARHPLPPHEATRLAAFFERLRAHWPDPAGSFLREAQWIGRNRNRPASLGIPRLHTWRYGFSWTLTLAAGFDDALHTARTLDPLFGRPWHETVAALDLLEHDRSPVDPLGLRDPRPTVESLLECQTRLALLTALLHLHAGRSMDPTHTTSGDPIRYVDPSDDPTSLAPTRGLLCDGPSSAPPFTLPLPEGLLLRSAPPQDDPSVGFKDK